MDFSLLNKEQIEAVKYMNHPLLVIAGAGSGKTRVLTYKIAYLIENGVNPYEILAITFTNKAANEMLKRVDKILNHNNRVMISTFHKFCGKVLRKYSELLGYEHNFTIYDTNDQKKLMRDILKDLDLDNKKIKEKSILSTISHCKNNNISIDEFEDSAENEIDTLKAKCFKEYEERKFKLNAMDFDDMILLTVRLLKNNLNVRQELSEHFKYILVDEYQDTNVVQFELIKLLCEKFDNLTVVGDDDQSIYKFRGADIKNILSFEKNFKNAKIIKLTQNYRSTNNILKAANEIIDNNTNRKGKNLWSKNGDGEKVVFTEYETDSDEAYNIINHIKNSQDYKNTAILYRTNFQSRILEDKCVTNGIPYILIGSLKFYDRKEIKDILSYLRFVVNGNDFLSFERAIKFPKRGIGDTTIEKIKNYSLNNNIPICDIIKAPDVLGIKGKTATSLISFYELIEKIKTIDTVEDMIDKILILTSYQDELLNDYDEMDVKDKLSNINELKNRAIIFRETFENSENIVDTTNVSSIDFLNEFLYDISLVADTDEIDENLDKISLMTIHSAKGLEYKNVYISGLNENIFPSHQSINEDEIEEERRLCYVAITRAKEKLYLSSARSRFVNGKYDYYRVSRFVDEINGDCIVKNKLPNIKKVNTFEKKSFETDFLDIKKISFQNPYRTGNQIVKEKVLEYKIGDRVSHIKFGDGKVLDIKEMEKDYEVTIKSDDYEKEKLMFAAFAKLKKI